MSIFIKHESDWNYSTSSNGSLGIEFVAIEGGKIWLLDPSGNTVSYYYGAAGAGLAYGLKLPRIGKLQLKVKGKSVAETIAPKPSPSRGKIYVLSSFDGEDLKSSDISGVCLFAEVFGGIVVGASATAMIFGMNPLWLPASTALGIVGIGKLLSSATGLLLMGGGNVGFQAGAGAAAFVGGLY